MSIPDWFDPLLRTPTPRAVVPAPWLKVFRVVYVSLFVAAVGLVLLSPVLGTMWGVGLASIFIIIFVPAMIEPLALLYRRRLRVGIAAMARVIPSKLNGSDVAWAAAYVATSNFGSTHRVDYEYATATGTQRGRLRGVSGGTSKPGTAFPEGQHDGARFVVLVNPKHPSRSAVYEPKGPYRIALSAP